MEIGNMIFGNSRGNYALERDEELTKLVYDLLDELGLDDYGNVKYGYEDTGNNLKTHKYKDENGEDEYVTEYDNGLVKIRSYYWGENEEAKREPNLQLTEKGIEISWYKYPLRDAYINQDISKDELKGIIKSIIEDVKSKG